MRNLLPFLEGECVPFIKAAARNVYLLVRVLLLRPNRPHKHNFWLAVATFSFWTHMFFIILA